jgi:hypothetical protein
VVVNSVMRSAVVRYTDSFLELITWVTCSYNPLYSVPPAPLSGRTRNGSLNTRIASRRTYPAPPSSPMLLESVLRCLPTPDGYLLPNLGDLSCFSSRPAILSSIEPFLSRASGLPKRILSTDPELYSPRSRVDILPP